VKKEAGMIVFTGIIVGPDGMDINQSPVLAGACWEKKLLQDELKALFSLESVAEGMSDFTRVSQTLTSRLLSRQNVPVLRV
jgi:hypothetical protein